MKVNSSDHGTIKPGTQEVPVEMSRKPPAVNQYGFIAIDSTERSFAQTRRMTLLK